MGITWADASWIPGMVLLYASLIGIAIGGGELLGFFQKLGKPVHPVDAYLAKCKQQRKLAGKH